MTTRGQGPGGSPMYVGGRASSMVRMPGSRSLLAVALAAAATLTLSASAHAWDVETLATEPASGGGLGGGHAALSGTGDLAVAWTEYRYPAKRGVAGMTYHEMLLTRTPGRPGELVEQPVERGLMSDATSLLAVDTATGPGTLLAVRPAGGAFGPFAEIAPASATLAVSWGGARLVDHTGAGGRILARVALPGGAFGAPEDLGTEGASGGPAFVVADDGQAVLVSTEYVGGAAPHKDVKARVRSAGAAGTWGPAVKLGEGEDVQLAMNARGDTVVAWRGAGATGAAYRPAGGAFGAAVAASKPYGAGSAHGPRAAMGPDGRAIVVTPRYEGGGLQPIERVDLVDGVPGAPGVVAADARETLGRLAIDAAGTAWLVHSAQGDGVAVRRAAAGEPFGGASVLTAPGEHVSLSGVDLEVDGRGGAAVTWEGSFSSGAPKRFALATEALEPRVDEPQNPGPPPGGGEQPGRPAQPSAPAPQGPGAQTVPPARVATVRGAAVTRGKGGRRVLAFTLDVPSALRVVVQRAASGRRVGKAACVRATRANRRKAACTRWVRVGRELTVAGVVGVNAPRVALPTRPGRYRVTITPAGGKATVVAFRVPAKKKRR